MEEAPQSFLYETLSPLSVPTAGQSSPSDDLEPYSVFRNEISLTTLRCTSPESAAPDFFSLDVNADGSDPVLVSPARPREAEPTTPAREAEPRLESGWFRGNNKFKSPMLQLHKEIVDFCEFLSPTREEQDARNAAIEGVFNVIKYIWPYCKVEVFGSFRTGLYLPTSDVDVVILGSGIPTPQQGLQALSRALSQRGIAKKIQVIAKARVPIIKFVEKRSGVAFDISFDVHNGPKAAEFIMDAVSRWPPLRPLCLILKVFLQQRELNEVYSGGLGSYALLAMLMAMLQSLKDCQTSQEENLGVLLVHFFDFYGRKLNTSDVGVSCNGGGTFFLKSSRGFTNKARPFLISIEDPQTPENDIGKNSFNYFQIRSAFAMAFATLTNAKTILNLAPNRSILGTIIRPDPVLIERKGGSNGQVTFDSLLPGAGEPLESQYGQQELLCNWQLNVEEEPLPRGDANEHSSGKKRKVSKEKSGKKKAKDNGEVVKVRHGEKRGKKKRHSNQDDSNGFGR
ncbi:hypothetical protein FEM48_Zijuj12G0101600 [Ziziphus jujuba var. spinosa]|uniref:polynucleotide adenylyltransferase n=1 Tax=Ziziphus jujuba var. spinosa TaxID=714518 RepID=A0A978UCQ0_ZIZJJ|nr:hypothetical protein FEM48_Zijuj12G0101600 [Ziziphus jujuba var. spinosa]